MSRRTLGTVLEITVPIALIAVIWVASTTSQTYYYPPLGEILRAFNELWLFERFSTDVLPSLTRLFAGYAIAVAGGVFLGLLLGRSRVIRRMTSPIVEFLRAIPSTALIPLAMLVFGVGDTSKIFLIAVACLWPILLNTVDGVSGVEPTLIDTGRVYRIGRFDQLRSVVLPSAAPQIFAGMRTSLSLAVILMVVSEMVASSNGIGYFVLQSQRTFAIVEMWSGIVLLGLLGYVLNVLFVLVENRVLAWHRGARADAR
ncbi:ABC transporter permease [Streptomyces avermitilis]|jgi:ABC-type nitrate/sulfonate/bicarbonate transport system permease component|uniref:ABC transporter permease n=1 Tax=Streptomyces avermitilis TaxID=33903 RepID=UPI0033B4DB4D